MRNSMLILLLSTVTNLYSQTKLIEGKYVTYTNDTINCTFKVPVLFSDENCDCEYSDQINLKKINKKIKVYNLKNQSIKTIKLSEYKSIILIIDDKHLIFESKSTKAGRKKFIIKD